MRIASLDNRQLSFPFAPAPRATRARATKPATMRVDGLNIAEALNRGSKVDFPKNANAIRVTIGSKTTVILKVDADTLKGAGVATAVEFGTVKNDAKGHPVRKGFSALAMVSAKVAEEPTNRLRFGGSERSGGHYNENTNAWQKRPRAGSPN